MASGNWNQFMRRAVLSMMAWSLSAEDRNELRELFLKFDEEKRGTITHEQMKQVLEDLYHIDSVESVDDRESLMFGITGC